MGHILRLSLLLRLGLVGLPLLAAIAAWQRTGESLDQTTLLATGGGVVMLLIASYLAHPLATALWLRDYRAELLSPPRSLAAMTLLPPTVAAALICLTAWLWPAGGLGFALAEMVVGGWLLRVDHLTAARLLVLPSQARVGERWDRDTEQRVILVCQGQQKYFLFLTSSR